MKDNEHGVWQHTINTNPNLTENVESPINTKKINIFGQLMIIIVAALSIGVAEVTQIATSKFDHPLLLRYINTAMLLIMFLPTYIWHRYYLCKSYSSKLTKESDDEYLNENKGQIYPYTFIKKPIYKLMLFATIGSIFENGGGYFFYLAVTGVTVPTFGALTALTSVFCFIFSVIFLNEKVILWKIIAVLLSFGGTIFFVFDLNNNQQSNETHDTWWGILFTLLVSIMWPANDIIFKIAYNQCFIEHKVIGTLYYTSMMGLIASIIFVFVLWIDPLTNNDWNNLWRNKVEIEWIIINGSYLVFTDMIYNITNSMTSPLMINIGNLLSIPFGFVVDIFVHHYKLTIFPIIGSVFIMIGFLMMEILKPPKCCTIFQRTLYQNKRQFFNVENKYHQFQ